MKANIKHEKCEMILQESEFHDHLRLYVIKEYVESRARIEEVAKRDRNIPTLDERALTHEFSVFFSRLFRNLDLALHTPGDAVFTQDHSVWSNGELDESSSPKVYFVLDGKYRSCVLMYLQEKRAEAQRRELAVW